MRSTKRGSGVKNRGGKEEYNRKRDERCWKGRVEELCVAEKEKK